MTLVRHQLHCYFYKIPPPLQLNRPNFSWARCNCSRTRGESPLIPRKYLPPWCSSPSTPVRCNNIYVWEARVGVFISSEAALTSCTSAPKRGWLCDGYEVSPTTENSVKFTLLTCVCRGATATLLSSTTRRFHISKSTNRRRQGYECLALWEKEDFLVDGLWRNFFNHEYILLGN